MSELVLAVGSIAGAFTAMTLDKSSAQTNPGSGFASELEHRMILHAMNRIYDHERAGRITSAEREQLLAKYRAQLERMGPAFGFGSGTHTRAIGNDLTALLDQRFAQLSTKIEDLRISIGNAPAPLRNSVTSEKTGAAADRKEPKMEAGKPESHAAPSSVETLPPADSIESSDGDGSLEDIKKQIMQTLSRLEQAEVE